jgi:SH3-like domain-containing protein
MPDESQVVVSQRRAECPELPDVQCKPASRFLSSVREGHAVMRSAFISCVLAVRFVVPAVEAPAQTRLPADASVHAAPNGPAIGTIKRGAVVRTGRASAGWTAVTLEGWIASSRLDARRDTLDRTITGRSTGLLRAADGTSQAVVAELDPGTLLKRFSERNGWTMVRRAAWVRTNSLRATTASNATQRPPQSSVRTDAPPPVTRSPAATAGAQLPAGALRTARATSLRNGPGGDERADVRAGAPVQTVARDRGWALVRIEGWVPERDLTTTDSSADEQLTAADLRANPAAHRGKIVRWDVQIIALQRADGLRKGLAMDEPYLLARAPGEDGAVLYIAVPPSLLERARSLPTLTDVTVTARVRDGRSEPVGVPILDLTDITRSP